MENSSAGSSIGSWALELCLGRETAGKSKVVKKILIIESTEIYSFCKNSLGNTIGAPKTASAGERLVSSLGCAQSPRSTKGNSSDQFAAVACARSASLRRWCSLLTAPFDSGWYAVVCRCEILSISQSLNQRLEVNCGPRSEVIVSGTPKREIQERVKAFAHASTDVSETGTASIHLDVYRASPGIFTDTRATVPLKVLTLQQFNSKNIRKIVVLSLHRPISGTSWFLSNVA
jgi:hypothetical protein